MVKSFVLMYSAAKSRFSIVLGVFGTRKKIKRYKRGEGEGNENNIRTHTYHGSIRYFFRNSPVRPEMVYEQFAKTLHWWGGSLFPIYPWITIET